MHSIKNTNGVEEGRRVNNTEDLSNDLHGNLAVLSITLTAQTITS